MAGRPNHETLIGPDFNPLLCRDCGQSDTAYVAKSGAIGCHSCGIHPDLTDEPSPGLMAVLEASLPPPGSEPRIAPWRRTGGT